MALRRLALVKSAERNSAWLRFAFVKIAAKKSQLLQFARFSFAFPKLECSKMAVVQTEFDKLALMRFAPTKNTELRFVPCRSRPAPKPWLAICHTSRDLESMIVLESISEPRKSTNRRLQRLKSAPRMSVSRRISALRSEPVSLRPVKLTPGNRAKLRS